jgi:ATP-binding cassette subfamily F protein 3
MLLLSCEGLARTFGSEPLFDDLAFELCSGERVGLVGPNGAGKSTLLKILAGVDRADRGEVRMHAGARAALLQQQPEFLHGRSLFDEAKSALDELQAAQKDMLATAEALARSTDEAEHKALAARYDRLNELLRHHDAYNLDHRVEHILEGLGFDARDNGRTVESFSGGQQSRLMLAKLLLGAPDVLLLDEPSNHLDIAATEWLESYLCKQSEAMLIVSHDRCFLDHVVSKIFELQAGRLRSFPGNYQAYTRLRSEQYEREFKTWQARQEYVARQEDYIRRVHYGQLHKQAQSRRKALARLEPIERPVMIDAPHMHFGEVVRSGDVVLQVEGLAKGYDRPLFSDLSFTLERGRRLGITGPNGCGKTTLLRILMGEERPDQGIARPGQLVQFGYYDQHLRVLDSDQTVIRAVWPPVADTTEQQMRDLLGRFGIVGDQAHRRVGDLSGGERGRVALARLVAQGVNVLVLDEPTNHLDLWACESLESALASFAGTVIVVSHDRYFLNRVVDVLILFEPGNATRLIFGNYETYEDMRKRSSIMPEPAKERANAVYRETGKPRQRKRKYPFRKTDDIEADLAAAEARLRELEQLLASPDLYRDGERVKETTRAFDKLKRELQILYEHWEEALDLN